MMHTRSQSLSVPTAPHKDDHDGCGGGCVVAGRLHHTNSIHPYLHLYIQTQTQTQNLRYFLYTRTRAIRVVYDSC